MRPFSRSWRLVLGAAILLVFCALLAEATPPILRTASRLYAQPTYRRLGEETLKLAGLCTAICLLLGGPLAWTLRLAAARLQATRRRGTARAVVLGAAGRATGLLVVLGEFGLVNLVLRTLRAESTLPGRAVLLNEVTVLASMVQIFAPFMVLALYRAMAQIDIGTVRALRSLGLSHARLFFAVAVPQALGGAAAGVATVFALSTGAYLTVALAGGRRVRALAGLAFDESAELIGWQIAAVALVLAGIGMVVLARWLGETQRANNRVAAPRTRA